MKKNSFKKKSNPLVSIIMNCHNGEKFLEQSLSSIFKQNYKNWEIIFWDNYSTDNSKFILKKFNDERIKYFYSKKFNTLYKSRNLAISKAKGKYLCFLDVDDQWKHDKLIKQVNLIEKLNSKFIYSNYQINNKKKNQIFLRYKGKLPDGNITQNLLNDYFIGVNTVMIKREIFKNYMFDDKYEIIGDFELFIKLSTKYKFNCIQKSLAIYNFHGENMSHKKLGLYISELNDWIKKNEKKMLKKFKFTYIKFVLFKLQVKNILQFFFNLY